jgi:hypothetical protein
LCEEESDEDLLEQDNSYDEINRLDIQPIDDLIQSL